MSWALAINVTFCTETTGPGKWGVGGGGIFIGCKEKKWREKVKRSNIEKRKMGGCRRRQDNDTKDTNGVDVAKTEWEKWLFVTDVRIISYLFISHCESYFRAAKNSFLNNCTHSMFPLSLILFNSDNEQQTVDVQRTVGEKANR